MIADGFRDWANIDTNSLEIIIDGRHEITAAPRIEGINLQYELIGGDYFTYESALYPVNEEVLRAMGAATRVQVRIEGARNTVYRRLSPLNIQRFKIFADTFLDGK